MRDDDRVSLLFGHWKRLVADLTRFGCSEEDARDFAQHALIETWKRLDSISPGAEWTYMRTAARHRAINEATRRPSNAALDDVPTAMADRSPSAEATLIARQELERFASDFSAAFHELPHETRLCVVLKSRNYSFKEIAAKLGLSWMAVQSRLHRATKHFRKRLGEPPPGIDWIELPGGNDDDDET
jgi:RNA polymerase sigma factor (sigma-70 family)